MKKVSIPQSTILNSKELSTNQQTLKKKHILSKLNDQLSMLNGAKYRQYKRHINIEMNKQKYKQQYKTNKQTKKKKNII